MAIAQRRTVLRRVTAWAERAQALKATTERARAHSNAVDATFEAIERDSDMGGAILAGALAYRLFVFALPLAFFAISVTELLSSAFGFSRTSIPNSVGLAHVIAQQIASVSTAASWWVALGSLVALAYATRVLFRAVSIVHALAWERSAASVKAKPRDVGVFALAMVCQVALGAAVGAVRRETAIGGLLTVLVYAVAISGVWMVISRRAPHRDAGWRDLVPGSILYGVGLSGIGVFNVLILGQLIASKSSTYGALGIAATLLLGFFLIGRVMVGAAVLNATLFERKRRDG